MQQRTNKSSHAQILTDPGERLGAAKADGATTTRLTANVNLAIIDS